jgi:hypothetical protein
VASYGRRDLPGGVTVGTSGYDAFISYSHALGGALAAELQTGLERFAFAGAAPT